MFFKTSVLKNFSNLTLKHLWWSFFLIKLQPWRLAILLKRDSNTDVFLYIIQNFNEHLFLQNTSDGCFCIVQVIALCNLDPSRPRQNCASYFLSKSLLHAQVQYCTSSFLVQCCLRCIWRTLSIQFSYAMFHPSLVDTTLLVYFAKRSCLLNMGQHCTGKFFAQCWST